MFLGSVPADLRSVIYEHAGAWPAGTDLYVGCSGNFTIERTLHARPGEGRGIHGNDVQAYTSALGWWLAGRPVDFELREEFREELGWLLPYLGDRTSVTATLMLGTRFLAYVGKDSAYHHRMLVATRSQFARMHADTVARLGRLTLRLGSYYCGDVREYLKSVVPPESPVALFPPFYAGDYEAQFADLDRFFDWAKPSYEELDEAGKDELSRLVADREHWVMGLHVRRPELGAHLRAVVQTANRGLPIYVYAPEGPRRIVRPAQALQEIRAPKIAPDTDLADASRMSLMTLTSGQFAQIRSQFMAKSILPGSPLLACGVLVDGVVVGAFAYLPPKFNPTEAYLMSDFPVSWSRYRRLAKLVVMAAISDEARRLLERSLSRRILAWTTTAYTDHPNSAKYGRGIPGSRLQKREDSTGSHRYQLKYGGRFPSINLDDMLADWLARHSRDLAVAR